MTNIRRFLYAWLLPPGLFLSTYLLSYYLFLKTEHTFWFLLVFLEVYLLSIQPVADALIKPLEYYYKQPPVSEIEKTDAIVILTGGYNKNQADFDGTGQIATKAANRFIMGIRLYNTLRIPIIISGTIEETTIASRTLKACGIKEEDIFMEGNSRNTAENAIYTMQLCRQKEIKKILLVTSAYHLPRSVALFQQKGLNAIPYPTDYRSKQLKKNALLSFAPSHNMLCNSAVALKEYLGILSLKIGIQ